MKSHIKLFPILLSFVIFIFSFFQCSFTSFAVVEDGKIIIRDFHDLLELGTDVISFTYCQLKSVYDGNFTQLISNDETFKSKWNEDNVIVDETTQTITFTEDLTAYMKQALIEYAEEVNGFELISTTNVNDLSASNFRSGYIYHSFRNLVHEAGLIAITGGGVGGNVCDQSLSFSFSLPLDSSTIKSGIPSGALSFVKASNFNSPYYSKVWYYDSFSWDSLTYRTFDCEVYYNTEEGHTAYKVITSLDECPVKTSGYVPDMSNNYGYIGWDPVLNFSKNFSGFFLYSTDGRKLKVFNSLSALKNYTAGQRGVYFGSGFYDTPKEIKVSFDDLDKFLNKDNDELFDKLKDLINSKTDNEDSLTEEDLEKLVDKLLEGINNSGGDNSGDNDNTGGNKPGGDNDNTGGIINGISGYLDTILEYLDGILLELGYISNQIEDMTAEAVEEKTDSILLELFSAFGEIGDLLKTKFPFSIPWDIYSMLSFLSSDDPYDMPARAAPMSYFGDDGVISYSSDDGLVIDYNNIAIHNEGTAMLIDDGGSHGGGGASRPGSDGHYDSEGNYHRAPFYEIPFQISKSMGIEGTLIIDLDPFIPLSEISRTMFTCIFIMSLVNLSTKIVDAMGDLFPS